MLAWMERIDAFDAKGHLLDTASYRVLAAASRLKVEEVRLEQIEHLEGKHPKAVRARILPAKGRPIDVPLNQKEPSSV